MTLVYPLITCFSFFASQNRYIRNMNMSRRLQTKVLLEFLQTMIASRAYDITVVRFAPQPTSIDKIGYDTLFKYLWMRERAGVCHLVENIDVQVKHAIKYAYLCPLGKDDEVPVELGAFIGNCKLADDDDDL